MAEADAQIEAIRTKLRQVRLEMLFVEAFTNCYNVRYVFRCARINGTTSCKRS
jgi:hypothetical protein